MEMVTAETKSDIFAQFVFSLIWGLGSPLNNEGRNNFDNYLHSLIKQSLLDLSFGPELLEKSQVAGDMKHFSIFYDNDRHEWLNWDCRLNSIPITEGPLEEAEFNSIFVPTQDTERYSFLLKTLSKNSHGALFIGETGTGKTKMVKKFLDALSPDTWEQN
jgi:dynein heavy chain